MKKMYRLARGTVRLEISGACPERLLNLCAENDIEFWDAAPTDGFTAQITAYAARYPDISALALSAGCELKLLRSRGGRRIAAAAKRRYALCAVLAAGMLALSASSAFVWNIRVEGNDGVSDAELVRALSDCGVRYGTFWPGVSTEKVRTRLLLEHPELSWATLNLSNSTAVLSVHERIDKPRLVSEDECAHVIAKKAGIISQMSVLEGMPCVAAGDTVAKGDVLVSGVIDSPTGDTRYVHAMAQVQARTWYELCAVTPLYENAKTDESSAKTRIFPVMGENRINFSSDSRNIGDSCDKIIKYKTASIDGVFTLPMGVMSEQTTLRQTELRRIDLSAAQTRLEAGLLERLHAMIGGGSIVSHSFSVSDDGRLLTVTLRAKCIENIGEEKLND